MILPAIVALDLRGLPTVPRLGTAGFASREKGYHLLLGNV
jgi:hypothetical protein